MKMRILFAATVAVGALVAGNAFAGSPYYDQSGTTVSAPATSTAPASSSVPEYFMHAQGSDGSSAADEAAATSDGSDVAVAKPAVREPAPAAVVATDPAGSKPDAVPEYFMHAQGSDGSSASDESAATQASGGPETPAVAPTPRKSKRNVVATVDPTPRKPDAVPEYFYHAQGSDGSP